MFGSSGPTDALGVEVVVRDIGRVVSVGQARERVAELVDEHLCTPPALSTVVMQ